MANIIVRSLARGAPELMHPIMGHMRIGALQGLEMFLVHRRQSTGL